MKQVSIYLKLLFILFLIYGFTRSGGEKEITIWLIGDSTVADYSLEENYEVQRFPLTGWGQVFQQFLTGDSLGTLNGLFDASKVSVDDRAKGGRSTRTFFEEGRWREVYDQLLPGDFVLIQFGHNDAATAKPERYVNPEGYKEYLRLFVLQARQKGVIPILITSVARNYPWVDGKLQNTHGDYPLKMKEVAAETSTSIIDLNELSMDFFSEKGSNYVSTHYFMNLPPGKYSAYADGQKDNTHFQPEGATEVARLVYSGMKKLAQNNMKNK